MKGERVREGQIGEVEGGSWREEGGMEVWRLGEKGEGVGRGGGRRGKGAKERIGGRKNGWRERESRRRGRRRGEEGSERGLWEMRGVLALVGRRASERSERCRKAQGRSSGRAHAGAAVPVQATPRSDTAARKESLCTSKSSFLLHVEV